MPKLYVQKKLKGEDYVHKPPEAKEAVATPDTYRITFGLMYTNWKSPKSTLT